MAPVAQEPEAGASTGMTMSEAVEVVEQHQSLKDMSFQQAIQKYDVVGVDHNSLGEPYVILADRRPVNITTGTAIGTSGFPEMRRSYLSPWTAWTREERVGDLRDKQGIRKYYDMKRADGTVRGALRALKTPILSARWFVEPYGTGGEEEEPAKRDIKIAEFVEQNLFHNLSVPWSRVIEEVLTMCEYGYSVLEKVWDVEKPGSPQEKIILKKLKPIHPLDIREWIYNDLGEVEWCVLEGTEANNWEQQEIHISKLLIFSLEAEGGDLRGVSILRSAYKHYYYKDTLYKIDAIQKERHGIGVPIIKLPMGFTEDDRALADDLGRNLRTNERAHITAPSNWEIAFAKLEGQPVDCLLSIDHHDKKIMSNVLTPFLDDPKTDTDSIDLFMKSTRYIANTIADNFSKELIPELVMMNFNRDKFPALHARRIGEWEDMRTMSFTLRNLVGASLITPDRRLEQAMRRELDIPPIDDETIRIVNTPQMPNDTDAGDGPGDGDGNTNESGRTADANPRQKDDQPGSAPTVTKPQPGRTGPPRQSNKAPVGSPAKNAGKDASGGTGK